MRYAARKDENQADIVDALRTIGCSVYDLGMPVDLLVGWRGVTVLMEVKDGDKSPSKRKHTDAQAEFIRTWYGGPVITVTSADHAVSEMRLACIVKSKRRHAKDLASSWE